MRKLINFLKSVLTSAITLFLCVTQAIAAPVSLQPEFFSTGVPGYRHSEFTGNSSSEIQLRVPVGINGFDPELVLRYSTNTQLSWFGQGWDLTLGRVTRSDRVRPITFTNSDMFVVELGADGLYDELFSTGGSDYSTLYKRRELQISKNGDTGWIVKNEKGVTYEFFQQDRGVNATEIWAWHLSRIIEPHGNTINISYTQEDGMYYINQITYSGRTITFNLEDKNLEHYPKFYKCGKSQLKKAVTSIQMSPSNTRYRFNYTQPSGLPWVVLESVDEIGSDNQTKRIATMTYQNGASVVQFQNPNTYGSLPFQAIEANYYVRMGDVNGDGIPDIMRNENSGSVDYALGTGSGWGNVVSTYIPGADGVGHDWQFWDSYWGRSYVRLADINGDGITDFVKARFDNNWFFSLGNGSGWNPSTWVDPGISLPSRCSFGSPDNRCFLLDVNGDRKDDIFYNVRNATSFDSGYALGNGNGWDRYQSAVSVSLPDAERFTLVDNEYTRPIDINGDRIADFVNFKVLQSGERSAAFVLGNGKGGVDTIVYPINIPSGMPEIFSFHKGGLRVVDLNNDSYPDLLAAENITSGTPWRRRYQYSLGQPVSGGSYTFGPVADAGVQFEFITLGDEGDDANPMFDFNNDGQIDIFFEGEPNNSSYPAKYVLNNTLPYFIPGILLSVRDEWGKITTFTYGNSYTYTGNAVPYRFPILTRVEERDNVSPTRTFDYFYENPRYSFAEREFQGFGHVRETDAGGIRKDTYFLQDRPRLGFVDRIEKSNGLTITNTYPNNTSQPYDNPLQSTTRTEAGKQVTTTFTYDNYGNVTQETVSANSGDPNMTTQRSFSPNTSQWLVSFPYQETITMGSSSKTVDFRYDGGSTQPSRGDLTQEIRGGITYTYGYDSYGNRTSVRDPRGFTTSYAYDSDYHSFLTQTTYPTNPALVETSSYWTSGGGFGQIRTKTDMNGNTTSYEYDGFGRLARVTGPNDSGSSFGSVSYAYNLGSPGNNYVETRETKEYGTSQVLYRKESKDGFQQAVQNTSDGEGGQTIISRKTYDYRGNMLTSTFPGFGSPGPTITHQYDLLDRITRITSPDSGYVEYGYSGWTTTVTDENRNAKQITRDIRDRITRVVEPGSYTTNYTYDVFDNLKTISDHNGNSWSYTYDSLGRKTEERDPDLGTISYRYDDSGNLIRKTDAKSITIAYDYDPINRMTQKDYSNTSGIIDVTYVYDETNVTNGKGKRTRMTDTSGFTRYFYDNEGRVNREEHFVGGFNEPFVLQWTYDAMDRIKNLTYPNGRTVQYTYNDQGLAETIPGFANNADYTALGQERRIDFSNSLVTQLGYRSDNQRLSRIYISGRLDQNYEYDYVGNITRVYDSAHGWNKSYSYDPLNRLTSGDGQSFGYNAIGNLTAKNGVTQQYSSNHPHALTNDGSHAYTYDEVGNMTSGNDRAITYDAENRPVSVVRSNSTTNFVYDGDGHRVIKFVQDTSGTQETLYIKDLYEKVV